MTKVIAVQDWAKKFPQPEVQLLAKSDRLRKSISTEQNDDSTGSLVILSTKQTWNKTYEIYTYHEEDELTCLVQALQVGFQQHTSSLHHIINGQKQFLADFLESMKSYTLSPFHDKSNQNLKQTLTSYNRTFQHNPFKYMRFIDLWFHTADTLHDNELKGFLGLGLRSIQFEKEQEPTSIRIFHNSQFRDDSQSEFFGIHTESKTLDCVCADIDLVIDPLSGASIRFNSNNSHEIANTKPGIIEQMRALQDELQSFSVLRNSE